MDPNQIGDMIGGFFDNQVMNSIMRGAGWIVLSAAIIAVMAFVWYFMQFKYKVAYPKLHLNKDGKTAQIIGFKYDRARDVKKNGVRKQHLFKARRYIEPFRPDDILPGNRVVMLNHFEDGTYLSMPIIRYAKNPIHFEKLLPEERFWGVLQLKENAITFQSEDAQKRMLFYTLITVVLCLVAAALTVWLSLRAPNQLIGAFDQWGNQFLDIANRMGGSPPPG